MPTARVNGVTLYAGLVILPMTGHTANIEEPGLFNLHIAEFLATVENGRWGTWKAEKAAQGSRSPLILCPLTLVSCRERRNDTQSYQRIRNGR
jgi:hypothetical protein